MEFVKSSCGSLLAQLAVLRFCCHAARTGYFRNARLWSAYLIPLPSRARSPRYRRTAQPRSPNRRSGGKVGQLAHPSSTHVTACLRSIFRPSSGNVTDSLNTLRRCSQAACACSTCVQAAGSVAVAAALAIKATFA